MRTQALRESWRVDLASVTRRPLFEDAYCKCACGGTMRTALDYRLHTHNIGECLYRNEKPRTSNLLDTL